jgi:hypothetical protein
LAVHVAAEANLSGQPDNSEVALTRRNFLCFGAAYDPRRQLCCPWIGKANHMTEANKDVGNEALRQHWGKQLGDVDLEIARLAMLCDIPLNDRSLGVRILDNDAMVCGKQNPKAFEKLRALLTMHMSVRQKAIESMGRADALALIDETLTGLRHRLGLPEKKAP